MRAGWKPPNRLRQKTESCIIITARPTPKGCGRTGIYRRTRYDTVNGDINSCNNRALLSGGLVGASGRKSRNKNNV